MKIKQFHQTIFNFIIDNSPDFRTKTAPKKCTYAKTAAQKLLSRKFDKVEAFVRILWTHQKVTENTFFRSLEKVAQIFKLPGKEFTKEFFQLGFLRSFNEKQKKIGKIGKIIQKIKEKNKLGNNFFKKKMKTLSQKSFIPFFVQAFFA